MADQDRPGDERTPRDEMKLRDEDRLPWLETVTPDHDRSEPGAGRVMAFVILGLAAVAVLVYAIYAVTGQRGSAGNGQLIAAQDGPYKVRPQEPGGMKVEGEGDAAIATSAGQGPGNGAIDLAAVPEAPVDGRPVAPTKPAASATATRNAISQVPASGGKLVATAPITARRGETAAASHGLLVQLGAYPSESAANSAWTGYAKRFAYLAVLGKSVQPVAAGGRTLYRLRVNTGSAAQAIDICGRLKVAGESCFIAS